MLTKLFRKLLFCSLLITAIQPAFANKHTDHTDMSLHHMHVMINHAIEMAAEGSSLVMLGKMDMASDIDNLTIQHGKKMISSAKKLIQEILRRSGYFKRIV